MLETPTAKLTKSRTYGSALVDEALAMDLEVETVKRQKHEGYKLSGAF